MMFTSHDCPQNMVEKEMAQHTSHVIGIIYDLWRSFGHEEDSYLHAKEEYVYN